jgi:hypothetical protein
LTPSVFQNAVKRFQGAKSNHQMIPGPGFDAAVLTDEQRRSLERYTIST